MWWKNFVLVIVFLYGAFCQDTNPEWLEPTTTSTAKPPKVNITTTTEMLPTTTTYPTTHPTTTYPTTTKWTTTTYPTTSYPTTRYPTTRYPTTRYPTTRYPTTKYPTTRYPTTRYPTTTKYPTTTYSPPLTYPPTPSTTKSPQEMCTISLSQPVVQYYRLFGMVYKSIVQCCNLCCYTKYGNYSCRKIAMEYCNLNTNRHNNYYNIYDYDYEIFK